MSKADQPGKDRRHDQVDSDQDEVASRSALQNPSLGRDETVHGDPQENEGVNECDQGSLAIVKNPKVIHNWLT